MNWHKWLVIPAFSVLIACTSSTQEGAIGIQRKQLLLLPSSQVDAMALQSYRGELSTAKQKGTLNTDKVNLERIRKIADRLIPCSHGTVCILTKSTTSVSITWQGI